MRLAAAARLVDDGLNASVSAALEQAPVLDNPPPDLFSLQHMESLRKCCHQPTIEHFAICKAWLMPVRSAIFAAMSVLFSGMTIVMMTTFHWDDSSAGERSGVLYLFLPWFLVCHGPIVIIFFIAAVKTWADPHTLIFDAKEGLILRSAAHDLRIAVENIKIIELDQEKHGEGNSETPIIRTRFSGGKLTLPRFAERERFLQVLTAAYPAIAIVAV